MRWEKINNNQTIKSIQILFLASLFWVLLGSLHLGSEFLGDFQSGRPTYATPARWIVYLSAYFTWTFITAFVYFLVKRNPPSISSFGWLRGFLLTMVLWVLLIALIGKVLAAAFFGGGEKRFLTMLLEVSPFLYFFNALKFAMIYGACTAIVYYQREQEAKLALVTLEREKSEILEKQTRFQLQALQAQLSPHFLFNSLNSLCGMARNNENARIVETVVQIGDLLRYAIEASEQEEVVLADELRFVDSYLALQRVRFENGFTFTLNIQSVDTLVKCPPFSIQTLIENVFSHNEMSQSQPISITANIYSDGSDLVINVENTPLVPAKNDGAGVGLRNLSERLNLLYGARASLALQKTAKGFSVTITLPMRFEYE